MTDIVFAKNNQVLTNSLLVAEKFERNHKDVLESVRELIKGCAEISAYPMFEQTTYVNGQNGQPYPMYIMNRDGFTLLVMGFTGEKSLRFKLEYIAAFNRMEEQLKQLPQPQSRIEHLQEILSLKDTIIRNQERIIELMGRVAEAEQPVLVQPSVTVIDEKSSIQGRSTRKRAMLTEYENISRFADAFFRNEDNYAHPVSKNEMMHQYIKFCGLGPSKSKLDALSVAFNKMLREYCVNNNIVVNPSVIFTSKSDRSEGYIRRAAYETEYKYGIPTVPEYRTLSKVCRCYYFYREGQVPETAKDVLPATGKEGLL